MIITGHRCCISCDFGIIYKHLTNQLLTDLFSQFLHSEAT